MPAIKIVTDSTLVIEPELIKKFHITIVPLTYTIEGVIYTDGDLTLAEYMDKVDASKNLPKTSQPPVGVFADIYRDLAKDGSQIISIHLAGTLSGTVEAARQGAALSGADVTVFDSYYTDQALAFQVVEAARLAEENCPLDKIIASISQMRESTELYCGVSTLENLIKGGRIGRVSGMIGSMMDIKVILYMKDAKLSQYLKGRGSKTFKKWLDDIATSLTASGRKVKEIGVSHVENMDFAKTIKDSLQKFVEKPITVLETSTVLATHTGRGTWAISINYDKNR